MTRKQERVREPLPVQVYLDPDDRARLERLAEQLETSKSEVLRRGLDALERAVTDPAGHPALLVIGLAGVERRTVRGRDAAREHDRVLAEGEEASWRASRRQGRRAR
jgi:Ribbon-helix-helix protein, copG family